MTEIQIRLTGDPTQDTNAVARALQVMKKKIKKDDLINELRRRQYYMSPSTYRNWKTNEAIKRKKRDLRKIERNSRKI